MAMVKHLGRQAWLVFLAVLLAGLYLAGCPSTPAYADQANPDSTPTVDFNVYRNILETGDMLLIIYANIPYSSTPDALVSEAFIWRWFDSDNVTELGSTVGFAYNSNGYGYNVFSMYLSASEAPTWDMPYTIRLSGNPAVFDTPPTYNYALGSGDYSMLTEPADVQAELAARLLTLATDLDVKWGLSASYSLVLEMETATVLSIYGEAVFRGCIYGCQALAPAIFRFSAGDIAATARTWTDGYVANLTSQYTGTWVATSKTGGGDLLGTGYDLTSIILTLGASVLLVVGTVALNNNIWSGLINVAFLMVCASRLEFFELTFLGLIAAICWLYVSARTWGLVR